MTIRICSVCGQKFNGYALLYDHKLAEHPEWRRKIARVLEMQIQMLQKAESKK